MSKLTIGNRKISKNIIFNKIYMFCLILFISLPNFMGQHVKSQHKKTGTFKSIIYTIWMGLVIMPHSSWANSQSGKSTETIFYQYETSADSCMQQFALGQAKLYLDSASLFVKKVNDPVLLGFYYQVLGNFYSLKRNDAEAHKNYYQAINYYEQSDERYRSNSIYYDLAHSYYQKQDTDMLNKIVSKIKVNTSKQKDETGTLDMCGVAALYYYCLFNKDKNNTACLDSVVFYESQFVSHFEADTSFHDPRGDVAFNYMMMALSMTKSKKYNPDSISYYLGKMKQWMNPHDTAMIVNQHWIEGEIAFDKKQFTEAKKIFNQLLTLLDSWSEHNNLATYIDIYDRLSEIAEIEKDFASALNYERKKSEWISKIYDVEKYKIITELSEKYESEKNKREIDQLQFREKLNWLYLGICILLLLISFFIIRWLLSRKKAIDSELLLAQTEKSEIELQAQLKDEVLKNEKLEKYESLLDIHFKNLDISEKDETIIRLKNEQHRLNEEIEKYTKRLQQYEQGGFVSAIEDPYFKSITNNVYNQITKRLTIFNEKNSYLESIQDINDRFFLNLKNVFQEDLSVINIKYCLCFAIGMAIQHIADCFCVEQRSIYVVRSRLKSKLNLDKTVDFNFFLRQLND